MIWQRRNVILKSAKPPIRRTLRMRSSWPLHLNTEQANLWQTNLAAIAQSLTGASPQPAFIGRLVSWKKNDRPNMIEFARAGRWVVVAAAQDHNVLLDETLGRVKQHAQFLSRAPGLRQHCYSWLAHGTNSTRTLPPGNFLSFQYGTNVITTGGMAFPDSEPLKFEAWNLPTNLISPVGEPHRQLRLKTLAGIFEILEPVQAGSPPDQHGIGHCKDIPWRHISPPPHGRREQRRNARHRTRAPAGRVWLCSQRVGGLSTVKNV